jgi:uncharacterized protein YukE
VSGGNLRVNPPVLQSAGTSFGQAADGLSGLQADAPLADAAGAVSQLKTADACRKAQSEVAAAVTALAERARNYGENLHTAAGRYAKRDQEAAEAIKKIGIPK